MAGELNTLLAVIAIGLAVLDFSCFWALQVSAVHSHARMPVAFGTVAAAAAAPMTTSPTAVSLSPPPPAVP